jgi:hypothetical protein
VPYDNEPNRDAVIMTALKILGIAIAIALIAAAAFVAHTPWRVHGGRFVAEYMMLAGAIGFVALVILAVMLIFL